MRRQSRVRCARPAKLVVNLTCCFVGARLSKRKLRIRLKMSSSAAESVGGRRTHKANIASDLKRAPGPS